MDAERQDGQVECVGDQGFTAAIDRTDWPIIGQEITVRRQDPFGEWPGRVVGFRRATRLRYEWRLRTGELREHVFYATDDRGVGSKLTIGHAGRKWEATAVEATPATAVRVCYWIKSGAERHRELFAPEPLLGWLVPQSDGSVRVEVLGPLAD